MSTISSMESHHQTTPMHFCWADLTTRDIEASRDFYCELFEWTAESIDIGPEGRAMILRHRGLMVASLSESSQETLVDPSSWTSYVAVQSADDVTRGAVEAGASLLTEPFDVEGLGREALLKDPNGALLALWQPTGHRGFETWDVPNALCHPFLFTGSKEVARAFYGRTFEWVVSTTDDDETVLFTSAQGERAAVMRPAGDDTKSQPSDRWEIGITVQDREETLHKIEALGATVIELSAATSWSGRRARARDPRGAMFSVVESP